MINTAVNMAKHNSLYRKFEVKNIPLDILATSINTAKHAAETFEFDSVTKFNVSDSLVDIF